LRRSIFACGLLLAFAGMTTAAAAAVVSNGDSPASTTTIGSTTGTTTVSGSTTTVRTHARTRSIRYWSRHLRSYRRGTFRWLTVIQGRPPRTVARLLSARSAERLPQLARAWQHREHAAWLRANHPPDLRAWMCIHHYEGSWTDSGGPYWGGLQMDYGFQATYGSWLLRHKGTADHWSPLEQIWVAVRASHSRGFSPWPNTARYCGVY
jgi:hypothetical protein